MSMEGDSQRGFNHLIAGTAAGLMSTAVVYPMDLVKTRYQVFDQGKSAYASLITAFRTIIKTEGPRALYQGLTPALVGSGFAWGGYFYIYELTKRSLRSTRDQKELGPFHHLGAGMFAGCTIVMATNPLWLVKTRLQLQNQSHEAAYKGFIHAVRIIVRDEGPQALYKGVVPALLLCGQGAIQFMAYEWLKTRALGDPKDKKPLAKTESSAMGAASKFISSLATYPFQVIKSRLQQRDRMTCQSPKYFSTTQCAATILRREGVRGFYKGCIPYAIKTAPVSAVTFLTYEETMKLLKRMKANPGR